MLVLPLNITQSIWRKHPDIASLHSGRTPFGSSRAPRLLSTNGDKKFCMSWAESSGGQVVSRTRPSTSRRLWRSQERTSCSVVGNIGLFDYLRFQRDHDKSLLHKSILHFEERVRRAKNLQAALQKHVGRRDQDDNTQAQLAGQIEYAHAWESIGYACLTPARISNGELEEALRCGEKSQKLTQKSKNSTIRGLSRFFYGYALLKNRKMDMAKERLGFSGLDPDMCTSAIALCREPLDNYPRYVEEITELGLDMERYDENGYSALDYTVFQDSFEMRQVVLRRLWKGNYEGAEKDELMRAETIQRLEDESVLKRHYREIFQEYLKPNLMKGGRDSIQKVRDSYADLLTKDETKKAKFDQLRVVSYADFIAHGRLPSFGDGITREYSSVQAAEGDRVVKECVVFFSYRWRIPRENRPDDSTKTEHGEGTQYGRMCAALKSLLDIMSGGNWHGSSLDSDNLYIWLVSTCFFHFLPPYSSLLNRSKRLGFCLHRPRECQTWHQGTSHHYNSVRRHDHAERAWLLRERLVRGRGSSRRDAQAVVQGAQVVRTTACSAWRQ